MDENPKNVEKDYELAEQFRDKEVKVYTVNGAALSGKLTMISGNQMIVQGRHGNAFVNLNHVISMTHQH